MLVHARAQVDQPLRSLDQSREDVDCERVDREDVRQAVGGEMVGLAIADSGVVDDGVETAERVDLRRNILDTGTGLQIAGDHLLGARLCPPRIVSALAIARMEANPMPLLDEQLSSHQAKSGR